MTGLQLAREIDRRDLLGGPVKLNGGREYGSAVTGWYYSFSHSLCCTDDAVLQHGCGHRRRGEAADNVSGPFPSRMAALRNLAEWIDSPEGREWAEAALAENDAQAVRASQFAAGADERRRAAKRAKRKRYDANRISRGLPPHRPRK